MSQLTIVCAHRNLLRNFLPAIMVSLLRVICKCHFGDMPGCLYYCVCVCAVNESDLDCGTYFIGKFEQGVGQEPAPIRDHLNFGLEAKSKFALCIGVQH